MAQMQATCAVPSVLSFEAELQVTNTLTGLQNTIANMQANFNDRLNDLRTTVNDDFESLKARRFENMKIVERNRIQLANPDRDTNYQA